ncbi:MAG: Stk1 family PASTA domain-containing Ser/Thr kinase [Actinomycetota bacterium]|nr:Stk1 family PASTA domain-containing Ser/Thr kinase [Actinomycetota bacterium]
MSEQGNNATVINDRYRIQRRVGRGGMADVFLARDLLLDRDVAVKVLFPEFAVDPKFVERFRREAQSAANLSHPNIVAVHDWGKFDGTYFIAMEYIQGRTLADICRNGRQLDSTQAAEIASEVAAALGFAHDAGLAHRDIKPANILIGSTGIVKVADFGIARAMNAPTESHLTQAGSVMGTASYFSPEQAQGAQPDPRSDLYSLGIVMYEMVAGRTPFTGENPVAIAYKQVHDTAAAIASHNPEVAPGYEAIVAKLMAKDPEARYHSAQALRDDLKRFRNGQTPLALAETASTNGDPTAPDAATTSNRVTIGADDATVTTPTTASSLAGPDIPGNPTITAERTTPGDMSKYPPGASPDAAYYEDVPPRTGWYALAAFIALVLLVIGGVVLYRSLATSDANATTRVLDDYSGQRLSAVTAALEELGLEPRAIAEEAQGVAEEFVHRTDPPAGTVVVEGTTVILYYNPTEALQTVPNVAGFTLEEARRQLVSRGFTTSDTTEVSDVAVGLVIRTEPAGGERIRQSEPVLIVVSGGPDEVSVPALVINQPEGTAIEFLQNETGLVVTVDRIVDATVPEGTVIRTDPAPSTIVKRGSDITVYVSSGPGKTTVPPLIGATEDQAVTLLTDESRQLVPIVEYRDLDDPDDPNDGLIMEQSIEGGTEVDKGTEVIIVVGVAPEPTTTTSTTTTTTTTVAPTTTTTTPTSTTTTTAATTSTAPSTTATPTTVAAETTAAPATTAAA